MHDCMLDIVQCSYAEPNRVIMSMTVHMVATFDVKNVQISSYTLIEMNAMPLLITDTIRSTRESK